MLQVAVGYAQCPTAAFDMESSFCKGQNLRIENTSSGAIAYEWDFCAGDLSQTPTAEPIFSSSSLFRARSLRIVKSTEGNWFGFSIDEPNNTLVRLTFGSSLDNTPVLTTLGNPSSALQNAFDLKFWQEGANWYALVPNKSSHSMLRLNFGTSLGNTPTVDNLGSSNGVLKSPSDVEIIKDGSSIIAFVTNSSSSEVVRLEFGSSITNTPVATAFSVSGSSGLRGISIIKECNQWFGLLTSYGSNALYYMDFQNGLLQAPTTGVLSIPSASYSFPAKVKIVNEGGEYVAFIQSAFPAKLYRLAFGSSITDKTGVYTDLTNFSISNDNYAFEIINDNSTWKAFSIDLSGTVNSGQGRLIRLKFPNTCGVDLPIQNIAQPDIRYNENGAYKISLMATDATGAVKYTSKDISVSNNTAPDILMESTNQCAGHDVAFTPINSSSDIVMYNWSFGDGTPPEATPDPVHQFATAGEFNIELEVTSSNGCKNYFSNPLKIYTPPSSSFSLPIGVICTNNELTFANSTSDNYDGYLAYQWYVDNVPVSTDRDLKYTFENTASKNIKLVTSIPGCADESNQNTSSLAPGPIVDFEFSGRCQDQPINFDAHISEPTNLSWNFDNDESSSDDNPATTYNSPGTYVVTLTAHTLAGCNNSKSKQVVIYGKPVPNFSVDAPPVSCSGKDTPFTNTTPSVSNSEIMFWNWNFGDPNSASNFSETPTGVHAYATAGTYTVELKAKTNHGCEGVTQKQISIAQSPEATFSNSATCVGVAASFTSTGSDIKNWYWEIGTAYYLSKSIGHTFNATGEQNVKLTVTGNNNCNMSLTRKVTIPVPLVPAFSVSKNCKGFEAEFIDNTSGNDPIVWRQWDVGGTISENLEQVKYTPSNTDALPAALTVKTQSGCTYSKKQDVKIWKAPVAKFTATPITGAIPLNIQIDNLSEEASIFNWTFEDGSVSQSTAFEPDFSFTTIGEHKVELKATNEAGCETIASKIVTAELPLPDAEIKLITLSQNPDKSLKVIITILNSGNTIIHNLPVQIDVSGDLLLRETIKGPVLPGEQHNLVLSYGIAKSQDLEFLCAQTELANDQTRIGNRSCIQFEKKSLIMSPYPNPATDVLNIEWLSTTEHKISIMITDGFGKALLQKEVDSIQGMNQQFFDVHELKAGIYFLVINDGSTIKTQRILISPKN